LDRVGRSPTEQVRPARPRHVRRGHGMRGQIGAVRVDELIEDDD